MSPGSNMEVASGDLVIDLLIPRHVVECTYQKDKEMFLARWIREIFRFMKIDSMPPENRRQSHVLLPSGSRTSSMRIPLVTVFDADENKTEVITNDMDLMMTHPDVIVGDTSGRLHMEFVPDLTNIGYGKIVVVSGLETSPDLFLSVTNEDGTSVSYLHGKKTIRYTLKDIPECTGLPGWQRTGPAYERLNVRTINAEKAQTTKADIVVAILSTKNYFKDDIEEVMAKSSWSGEIKEAVLSTPISFVHVAPKTFEDDVITWRVSFSMQELVIARSLSTDLRQLYTVIKFAIKYLWENNGAPDDLADKKFSSYLLMNAFFAFCDLKRDRDWSVKKMETVCHFFKYVTKCLTQQYLPQYFFLRNNLIKDVTTAWLNFYSELFTFTNELAILKFLLTAQRTWRMPHFERPVQAHWSGEDLTINTRKMVLTNITLDAMVNLKLVRVVQTLWNHFEILQSLSLRESDNEKEKEATKAQVIKYWEETFLEMEALVRQGKVSKTKYICLLRLIQEMTPLADDVKCTLQEKLNGQKCDVEEETELQTYFTVGYKDHGEIEDCAIRFNNLNIRIKVTKTNETYVFPYTDHIPLHSEPFIYFLFCEKLLWQLPPHKVQNIIDDFLDKKYSDGLQHNPVVKLSHILKNAFTKNRLTFHDFGKYKVSMTEVKI